MQAEAPQEFWMRKRSTQTFKLPIPALPKEIARIGRGEHIMDTMPQDMGLVDDGVISDLIMVHRKQATLAQVKNNPRGRKGTRESINLVSDITTRPLPPSLPPDSPPNNTFLQTHHPTIPSSKPFTKKKHEEYPPTAQNKDLSLEH
ncbi:hypothetical protein AMTR_s00048p00175230 [Amborella trichopoda]|uniref:Uncharacterized protein n=1 Tax=Amborella trichopoda TaxID=13333 RepID=U5D061_AMBTC|nr:hypothetical protein AMTR_s00048p00175230 [Amborella trichopoda]